MNASLSTIADRLSQTLSTLRFGPPVTRIYNPLVYARSAHAAYLKRYGKGRKEFLLVGMNPGPWGMVQTGVPFGEIAAVRDWLGIETAVQQPTVLHPKRPVQGFACRRSEVSGRRLWGWIRARWGTPEIFFRQGFVANYCPLAFFDAAGRNLTPDKLPAADRAPLLAACDVALRQTVDLLQPAWVLGVGAFAEGRARQALAGATVRIGRIPHPSPASPLANRGWASAADAALRGYLGAPDIGDRISDLEIPSPD
jgi:single-strand selective monofunctional uracil DNA glycosylase